MSDILVTGASTSEDHGWLVLSSPAGFWRDTMLVPVEVSRAFERILSQPPAPAPLEAEASAAIGEPRPFDEAELFRFMHALTQRGVTADLAAILAMQRQAR